MLVIEGNDFPDEGNCLAFEIGRILCEFQVVKHHRSEFQTALPVVPDVQIIRHPVWLSFSVPSVIVNQVRTPRSHGFREIGPFVVEVFFCPEFCQRQCIAVHVKKGFDHFMVPCMQHGPVNQPCILEPEIAAPFTVVGIKTFFATAHVFVQVNCKNGTIEFDGKSTPSGAGIHVALQGVCLRDLKCFFFCGIGADDDIVPVPKGFPPGKMVFHIQPWSCFYGFFKLFFNRLFPCFDGWVFGFLHYGIHRKLPGGLDGRELDVGCFFECPAPNDGTKSLS